mmetsp:Transcript_56753/g.177743  ORF Transcript_56753/g.177743 Transcript_56753/m.177743 type:complete len:200 (-) Transcript_56753:386-985(-)
MGAAGCSLSDAYARKLCGGRPSGARNPAAGPRRPPGGAPRGSTLGPRLWTSRAPLPPPLLSRAERSIWTSSSLSVTFWQLTCRRASSALTAPTSSCASGSCGASGSAWSGSLCLLCLTRSTTMARSLARRASIAASAFSGRVTPCAAASWHQNSTPTRSDAAMEIAMQRHITSASSSRRSSANKLRGTSATLPRPNASQ